MAKRDFHLISKWKKKMLKNRHNINGKTFREKTKSINYLLDGRKHGSALEGSLVQLNYINVYAAEITLFEFSCGNTETHIFPCLTFEIVF